MIKTQRWITLFVLFGLLLAPFAGVPQPAAAQATVYSCLPSCESNDGRMLSIAGADLATLTGINISLKLVSPANAATLEVGFFDGDGVGTWDFGDQPITFMLFADPTGRGSEAVYINAWSGAGMTDNTWYTSVIPNDPRARSASGAYFYHLLATVNNSNAVFINNFKIRTDGVVALLPRPFSYMASMFGAETIINPPNAPTTYDGTFDFYTDVTTSVPVFRLWDGDLDFGHYDGVTTRDTNDPDTPDTSVPSWSSSAARLEGVAVGFQNSTGNPPDDTGWEPNRRSPSVSYSVSPLGQTPYVNDNASGNLEWERFSISSVASDPGDHNVQGRLPAGMYKVHMNGMDLNNLNAWRFPWEIIGVCVPVPGEGPDVCKDMSHPYLIGDYVWADADQDGVQDAGEAPIPGVRVELFDGDGIPVRDVNNQPRFAITDANGLYTFDVEQQTYDEYTGELVISGRYSVVVASTNFQVGQPLAGMRSTTGGNTHTDTVIDANILTYDFGYWSGTPDQPEKPFKPGPFQYGWFRKWPQYWPLGPFTIGGVSYTKEQALALLNTPGARDMTYRVAWQSLAVTLNLALGYNPTCIADDLAASNAWLVVNPVGSGVLVSDPEWQEVLPHYTRLILYNSNRLCARQPQ